MLLASKFEEIYFPTTSDFVYISDNSFQLSDIVKTEKEMLKTLNYELCYPTPIHFLRRYSKAASSSPECHAYAKYLLEVASVKYVFFAKREPLTNLCFQVRVSAV